MSGKHGMTWCHLAPRNIEPPYSHWMPTHNAMLGTLVFNLLVIPSRVPKAGRGSKNQGPLSRITKATVYITRRELCLEMCVKS